MEVRSLDKTYRNGTRANRDISLTVRRGELLGILGPNGAGKTTLVRQITTELVPTAGEVRVFGIDAVAHPNRVKGLMGVMPQEANLYYQLSVWHHLRIFGKLRGLPRRQASSRAEEVIADLGLHEHRDKAANELSGGLRRRLLLGIAALAAPPLMVLDEPSAGLDPEARRDLWELLRGYRRRGVTVPLTTHYMEEAEVLCDRVGVIQDGSLLALDTIANLRADHGFEYKIGYEADDRTRTVYGADDRALVQQVLLRMDERTAIESAAIKSGAAGFVGALTKGYDTMLGRSFDESGQDISAGQWQRLASARAYFREASVLVLDEPTAALDAKAEVEVYKRFRDMSQGKSVLLISHRLGSARLADRIVFLDGGRIVEQGTHDELMALKGAYAKLYSIQADWYH